MKREFATLMILAALAPPAAAQTADFRGAAFAMQGGEAVFRGICQGCHMADAKGATGRPVPLLTEFLFRHARAGVQEKRLAA